MKINLCTYLQKEINNWPVACEADSFHINALLTAFFLFHFEYVAVEVILQLLIGYIDAHLGGERGRGRRREKRERRERRESREERREGVGVLLARLLITTHNVHKYMYIHIQVHMYIIRITIRTPMYVRTYVCYHVYRCATYIRMYCTCSKLLC